MEKTYIENSKVIEFICETAHRVVREQFGDSGDAGYIDDGNGGTSYSEEAQDLFNDVYDDIEGDLNKILGVHTTNDLEVIE